VITRGESKLEAYCPGVPAELGQLAHRPISGPGPAGAGVVRVVRVGNHGLALRGADGYEALRLACGRS
jgi:hypothetical protein